MIWESSFLIAIGFVVAVSSHVIFGEEVAHVAIVKVDCLAHVSELVANVDTSAFIYLLVDSVSS